MDRVKRLYPLCIAALLAFYAVLAFYALHPAVSRSYCEYFLSGDAARCAALPPR